MIDSNHMNKVEQHDIYVVHFQEGSYIHWNCVSINILRERKHRSTATLAAKIFWETPRTQFGALLYRSLFFLQLY